MPSFLNQKTFYLLFTRVGTTEIIALLPSLSKDGKFQQDLSENESRGGRGSAINEIDCT